MSAFGYWWCDGARRYRSTCLVQELVIQPHLPIPLHGDRPGRFTLPDQRIQFVHGRLGSVLFRVLDKSDKGLRSDERVGRDRSVELAPRDLSEKHRPGQFLTIW